MPGGKEALREVPRCTPVQVHEQRALQAVSAVQRRARSAAVCHPAQCLLLRCTGRSGRRRASHRVACQRVAAFTLCAPLNGKSASCGHVTAGALSSSLPERAPRTALAEEPAACPRLPHLSTMATLKSSFPASKPGKAQTDKGKAAAATHTAAAAAADSAEQEYEQLCHELKLFDFDSVRNPRSAAIGLASADVASALTTRVPVPLR